MIECIALPLTSAQRLHNALKNEEVHAWCTAPSGHLSPVYGPEGKGGWRAKKPEVREESLRTHVLNVLMSCCKARNGEQKPLAPTSTTGGAHVLNVLMVGQRGHICVLALDFTAGAGRGTIRLKPKGPVRKNTFSEAVAAPTEKRGFVTPNFWGWCVCTASRFWGVVGVIRKDARTASDVFLTTTLHPTRVRTQTVALVTPEGAKTMTTSPVASRSAVPTTTPTTGNTPHLDPVALHFEAVNACAMARWYAARHRHTEAARKLRQGLAALRRLAAFERAEAAA